MCFTCRKQQRCAHRRPFRVFARHGGSNIARVRAIDRAQPRKAKKKKLPTNNNGSSVGRRAANLPGTDARAVCCRAPHHSRRAAGNDYVIRTHARPIPSRVRRTVVARVRVIFFFFQLNPIDMRRGHNVRDTR